MDKLIILVIIASASEVYGVIFDCNYVFETWAVLGNVYVCRPNVSNTDGNTLNAVTGVHVSGRSNEDVRVVFVNDQNLSHVPPNLVDFFPNLGGISWRRSNLLKVSADDLKSLPGLMFFRSLFNPLVSLDGDLFQYTPNIQNVAFHNNSLEHVGYDLLKDLTGLNHADFSDNPCINVFATTPQVIRDLKMNLSIQCPPLSTTTTSDVCSAGCVDHIDATQNEVLNEVQELRERIFALEKQLKELSASPSSCSHA